MTNQRQITLAEMAPHIHNFLPNENKVAKLTKWLKDWIDKALATGKAKPYDRLPSKADLACHVGVSMGTMQNVYRVAEDEGYIESKQRIGSYIKGGGAKPVIKKLTSKREIAAELIKKHIAEYGYKTGEKLISTRKLAKLINTTDTTVRVAILQLVSSGILEKKNNSFFIKNLVYDVENIKAETLVEKIAKSLKKYLDKNYKDGMKLPANSALAEMFSVSIKTMHDAVKLLSKEGVLYTRRGRYGTIIVNNKEEKDSVKLYDYERIEQKIRAYIQANCAVGDKIPSIRQFSAEYKTSEKTVKKALNNLASDGYLMFSRGRYGGTFVTDIPETLKEAYKWLALNSEYINGN